MSSECRPDLVARVELACRTALSEATQPLLSQLRELGDGIREHVEDIAQQRITVVQRQLEQAVAERDELAWRLEELSAERDDLVGRVTVAERRAEKASADLRAHTAQLEQVEQALHASQAWAHALNQRLLAVHRSRSWRLMAPARHCSVLLRGAAGRRMGGRVIVASLRWLDRRGWLVHLSSVAKRITPKLWQVMASRFVHQIRRLQVSVIGPQPLSVQTEAELAHRIAQAIAARRIERGV